MLDKPMIEIRELRNAFGCLPTGVSVVTLYDEERNATGVTVGSFTSLSIAPALCLFSLGENQASARLLEEGVPFVVNVLSHAQADVAWQFSKPLKDKCEGIQLAETLIEVPRLIDCIAYFVCRTAKIHVGGDHVIVVGEIIDFDHDAGNPLVFHRGQMHKVAPL